MSAITVFLENQKVLAHVGWYERERKQGVELMVSVRVKSHYGNTSDDLADTVDYARLVEMVNTLAAQERKLLESLASDIADAVEDRYKSRIKEIEVHIRKSKIDTPGYQADHVGISLVRNYENIP